MFTEAFAQTAATGAHGGSPFSMFVPLIFIFIVFYFLLIRPQQKKQKEHQAKLSQIQRGNKIVTGGGFIGKVTKIINDSELEVELSEGVRVRVLRSMVVSIVDGDSAVASVPSKVKEQGAEKSVEEKGDVAPAPEVDEAKTAKPKKTAARKPAKKKE